MLLGLAPVGPHAAFPLARLSEVTEICPGQAAAARAIRAAASGARQVDVLAVRGLGILGLAGHDGLEVEVYQYRTPPIWRLIRADETMFAGTFDSLREGHSSPVYRLPGRVDGTLHRAYCRVIEDTVAARERLI